MRGGQTRQTTGICPPMSMSMSMSMSMRRSGSRRDERRRGNNGTLGRKDAKREQARASLAPHAPRHPHPTQAPLFTSTMVAKSKTKDVDDRRPGLGANQAPPAATWETGASHPPFPCRLRRWQGGHHENRDSHTNSLNSPIFFLSRSFNLVVRSPLDLGSLICICSARRLPLQATDLQFAHYLQFAHMPASEPLEAPPFRF